MATELILIRHGHAVRIKGDYVHAPLTRLGQEQAAQTGQYLSEPHNHLDGFYSSPLRRTQETAKIIGEKIGQSAELRTGMQELRLMELPVLAIFEILSILDPVEDYLDEHAGRPIHWPIAGRVSKVQERFPARPLFDLSNEHFSPKWLSKTLPSRWMQSGSSCYMMELWLGFCPCPAG